MFDSGRGNRFFGHFLGIFFKSDVDELRQVFADDSEYAIVFQKMKNFVHKMIKKSIFWPK